MANSVTGPYPSYGAYPTNIQPGYNTSPPCTIGSAGSYSTYDTSKAAYSGAMLSFSSTPAAPTQQYSTAYYTQPAPSISYGQHSTSGLYNTGYTSGQPIQQSAASALSVQQQLAAAATLQRGYQSPPYGGTGAGYPGSSLGSSSAVAAAASYADSAALYKQAAYNEHVAAAQHSAAAAQHSAAVQHSAVQHSAAQHSAAASHQHSYSAAQATPQPLRDFQHKTEIVDSYASNGNRLQASIIPHHSGHSQHILSNKQLSSSHNLASPPPPSRSSNYSHLDALQSSFSAPPPPPPPPPPPKPSHISSSRMISSSMSRNSDRHHHGNSHHGNSHRNNSVESSFNSSQHMFRKNNLVMDNSRVSYKMPFQKTLHMHNHLCEICKVSCASSKTYKDHIEGQRHKKRVALREQQKKEEATPTSGASYKCVLCDVTCTGEETFNAHVRGMKHFKAEKLYKELGKEIPAPVITGDTEPKPEVPIVGADLIEIKSDSTKSAKVIYTCKMCECTFNDELAKNLHLKGRRHRLNYKKNYDPTLKVEIQPSKREKIAEQKARRRAEDVERRRNMVQNRRHLWEQNRWRAEEEWREWAEARSWHQYESAKQKQDEEYEERCNVEKERCKKMGLPAPSLPPRPHLPPPPPRMNNSRFMCPGQDEFLMVQKQTMVSPKEEHLDALQDLVRDVEQIMREVSDDLSAEAKEQITAQGITTKNPARIISTMHKTGALTKAILLKDDMTADIAVLCTEKPTQSILNTVYSKFKDLYCKSAAKEKGKLKLQTEKAMFCVVLGESPQLNVNVKLTSPAFDPAITEDERREELVSKVLERIYCLKTMSDVNETGWYKMHIKPNTPAVIVLNILSSLRLEPECCLKNVSIQALQVLLFIAVKTFGHVKNVAPTLILRRLFEILAAGYVLTEKLMPPWHQAKVPAVDLLDKLDEEQKEEITEYAQFAVRCIALGNLHKVLQIPPPPSSPANTFPATPRPRTN